MSVLKAFEEYIQPRLSMRSMGHSIGLSGSGFYRICLRIAESLKDFNPFHLYKPHLSNAVCVDTTPNNGLHFYVSKDPFNKIAPLIQCYDNLQFDSMKTFMEGVYTTPEHLFKVVVSDGDSNVGTSLEVLINEKVIPFKGVRTIWLGRHPGPRCLKIGDEKNTYLLSIHGEKLVVDRGIIDPQRQYSLQNERHHMTTIQTILSIFKEKKPSRICLMSPESYIHFLPFLERFCNTIRGDCYLYHIIGTGTHGNNWAEAICRFITRRNQWFDEQVRSIRSQEVLAPIRAHFYNLLVPQKQLDNQTPFRYAGAEYTDEEVYETLLNAIQ